MKKKIPFLSHATEKLTSEDLEFTLTIGEERSPESWPERIARVRAERDAVGKMLRSLTDEQEVRLEDGIAWLDELATAPKNLTLRERTLDEVSDQILVPVTPAPDSTDWVTSDELADLVGCSMRVIEDAAESGLPVPVGDLVLNFFATERRGPYERRRFRCVAGMVKRDPREEWGRIKDLAELMDTKSEILIRHFENQTAFEYYGARYRIDVSGDRARARPVSILNQGSPQSGEFSAKWLGEEFNLNLNSKKRELSSDEPFQLLALNGSVYSIKRTTNEWFDGERLFQIEMEDEKQTEEN